MRISTALRLLHLISLLPPALAAVICYDITSPMHPEILTPVNCWSDFAVKAKNSSMDDSGKKFRHGGGGGNPPGNGTSSTGNVHSTSSSGGSDSVNLPFFNFAPDAPLNETFDAPALPPPTWNDENKIKFQLDCRQPGFICDAMNQTLYLAGWYVSQMIYFKSTIYVNASLTDFCYTYNQCNTTLGTDVILGGAVPARTFPLVDSDGVVRYYPQAVVRQMDFAPGTAPQCGPSDILMEFNSKANFFYQLPNTTTITADQFDFLTVAIHELMHGLGFMSAWADYLQPNNPTILTPQIALGNPTSQQGVIFEGFVEYAYDRLMSFPQHPGLFATNLTATMIKQFGNLGVNFTDAAALGTAFLSSQASTTGKYMDGNATTQGAIEQSLPISVPTLATLNDTNSMFGPPITLETSFNPFASGSSLNHVDGSLYLSTQDFLMRYSTPKGKTLQQLVDDYGTTGDKTYGPFGPGLRYILGGIGYRIRGGIPLGGSIHNLNANTTAQGGGVNSGGAKKSLATRTTETSSKFLWRSVYCVILGSLWVFA